MPILYVFRDIVHATINFFLIKSLAACFHSIIMLDVIAVHISVYPQHWVQKQPLTHGNQFSLSEVFLSAVLCHWLGYYAMMGFDWCVWTMLVLYVQSLWISVWCCHELLLSVDTSTSWYTRVKESDDTCISWGTRVKKSQVKSQI